MHSILRQMMANGGSVRLTRSLKFSEKDQLRRMMYGGLVIFDVSTQTYTMTDAGKAVLKIWEQPNAV